MKTWICIVCGFIYDEAAGLPEEGIAPGTVWADVPAHWACPDCGVAKADFEAVDIRVRPADGPALLVQQGSTRLGSTYNDLLSGDPSALV
ncbi:MAG: rubredoxin [Betaproteobacteria bacterium]|nr:rubredoxin [Betaproteobacteria bacterium]